MAWDLGWGGGEVATAASGDAAGSRGSRLQLAAANREYSGRADGVSQLFQPELEAAAPEPSCSALPPPSYLIWLVHLSNLTGARGFRDFQLPPPQA